MELILVGEREEGEGIGGSLFPRKISAVREIQSGKNCIIVSLASPHLPAERFSVKLKIGLKKEESIFANRISSGLRIPVLDRGVFNFTGH